jgi:Family of unknown function (DUF6178)
VPQLPAETVQQLIRHCGLEACGEIVASATPAQLASVLDIDLWRNARPGRDERFDADRFEEWLELLLDMGGAVAARTLAAMEESLLVAGLSRHVRVFDLAAMASSTSGDDEPMDVAAPHKGPECEVSGYLVRARKADGWDAIVALLLALETDHPNRFHLVMGAVRRLSDSTPEIDGLDDLLTEPEQRFHDVAVDRDHRRSRQGYITPADARAFLQMVRRRSDGQARVNPIVAAYFRDAADDAASGDADAPGPPRRALAPPLSMAEAPEAFDAVAELLVEAGFAPPRPRALLKGPELSRLARIQMLMECVGDDDPAAYLERGRELAFLANTLVAGCSIQSRPFTPQEASEAALSVCQVGLEHWPTAEFGETLPNTFLVDHGLIAAFEVGWSTLHDTRTFVADQLIVVLADLRFRDADIQDGLHALRRELKKQHEAGTPWRACDALEVMAMIDMPAWVSLLGLLGECPIMPVALTAALEGRTGAISATDFEFISTRRQLSAIREFMARLPEMFRRSGGEVAPSGIGLEAPPVRRGNQARR